MADETWRALQAEVLGSDWYQSRPAIVQSAIRRYPPHLTYRLETTGQHVRIYSYDEGPDGSCETCTVTVLSDPRGPVSNAMTVGCNVFGIPLSDLTPLPTPF